MDVSEIDKKRTRLEAEIKTLIQKFNKETMVSVGTIVVSNPRVGENSMERFVSSVAVHLFI